MRDWNSALRISYMTLLESIGGGVNVYYGMAPSPAITGSKYIVISAIDSNEQSDKNSFDGNVAVLLDIVALGKASANITDSESMVNSVKGIINSTLDPNMAPYFKCVTTRLTSDQQLTNITTDKTVVRRLLRYEHFIGQIS